jgi:hypothetical protein
VKRKHTAMLGLLVPLVGCTTLAPHAQDVKLTYNTADVQDCKAMGSVSSDPPYILPDDFKKQLRNQAVGLNADTVFINGHLQLVHMTGIAYRCNAPLARAQ